MSTADSGRKETLSHLGEAVSVSSDEAKRPYSPEALAYAAGFFDGEGSVSIGTRKSRHVPGRAEFTAQLAITQTGEFGHEVLVWFADHFGGKVLGPVVRKRDAHFITSQPYYVWAVSAAIARDFLAATLPYLIRNRPQAENALELLNRPRIGRRRMSDEEYELRWGLYQRHRSLNQGKRGGRLRTHVYDIDTSQKVAS